MNIRSEDRVFDFLTIRDGCVFRCGESYYIKGNAKFATDLKTGQILEPNPANDVKWKNCQIYPRAYMNLH